jgi:hypothetical protein
VNSKFWLFLFVALGLGLHACNDDDDDSDPPPSPQFTIGQLHAGGVIFYLDDSGNSGLVCAVNDQSIEALWGCPTIPIQDAFADSIGSGQTNTQNILDQCDEQNIAARLCDLYENEGFVDWFLPSLGELAVLQENKDIVEVTLSHVNNNSFDDVEYWSSSQDAGNTVWAVNFSDGSQLSFPKDGNMYNVRAIRRF